MDGFRIGRVRGIDLSVNWSVLIIAVLVTWSLADSVFPTYAEGQSQTAYWTAAAITSFCFFAALMAHELGHSIVALRYGVEVTGITLWLFGGVAMLGSQPTTPRTAFRIAAAGPAVSAALATIALLLSALFSGLTQTALLWFGVMNLVLVGFNLLPAFPLDGGRIYQAWRWHRSNDRVAATQQAAQAGLVIGAILVGIGFVEIIAGMTASGVWLMLIGWFIREAARAEWRQTATEGPLSDMTVRQVMSQDPVTVDSATTIENFVAGLFFGGRHAAYPVADKTGAIVGLITLNSVRSALAKKRGDQTVGEVATPLSRLFLTTPGTSVAELLQLMNQHGESRALVFEGDNLVGIVSPSDVARLVAVIDLASA